MLILFFNENYVQLQGENGARFPELSVMGLCQKGGKKQQIQIFLHNLS